MKRNRFCFQWACHKNRIEVAKLIEDSKVVSDIFGDPYKANDVVQASNYLALNLYRRLSEDNYNLYISPFGLSAAFALLHRASSNECAFEMERVLGYKHAKLDVDTVGAKFLELVHELRCSGKLELRATSAMLGQKNVDFEPEFMAEANSDFLEVHFLDRTDTILRKLAEWVAGVSRGQMDTMGGPVDPDSILVLLGNVYFRSGWSHEVTRSKSKVRRFYNEGVESRGVDVNTLDVQGYLPYLEKTKYRAAELPLEGGVSIVVVLPKQRNGLRELEQALCSGRAKLRKRQFKKVWMKLTMPRLHVDCTTDLRQPLDDLGMKLIFTENGADLGGLAQESRCFVSAVSQRVVFDLREDPKTPPSRWKTFGWTSKCLKRRTRLLVDHPFLFVVLDKHRDLILYMGRIVECDTAV